MELADRVCCKVLADVNAVEWVVILIPPHPTVWFSPVGEICQEGIVRDPGSEVHLDVWHIIFEALVGLVLHHVDNGNGRIHGLREL